MPAIGTSFGDQNGHVTQEITSYYQNLARGGIGLMITENISVHPSGRTSPFMLNLHSDDYINGIKQLVSIAHENNAKIFLQLNHGGRQTSSRITDMPILAPSSIPCPLLKEQPRQLNKEQILELTQAFITAAYRAKQSGADGVELQMGHGYLICEFLSQYSNHRTDEYGGTLENRMRFAKQIIKGIKEENGNAYPVICRISADEMVDGGINITESTIIAKALEKSGADAIHVSACNYESYAYNIPCYYLDEGCFVPLSAEIKKAINIPVIAVGRIRSPFMASQIIKQQNADLIAMGRALIADPDLPKKIKTNQTDFIRPCLSCNQFFQSMVAGKLKCAVNPNIATPQKKLTNLNKKKVFVIGGGVSGMEAARTAALSGAKVTLYEQNHTLGGQVYFASLMHHKSHFSDILLYYKHELERLNINVQLNTKWAPNNIHSIPDTLILATGSTNILQDIKNNNCTKLISYEDTLRTPNKTGETIVIIGGSLIGLDLADFLSSIGKKVILVDIKNKIGNLLPNSVGYHLKKRLASHGVSILTKRKVLKISDTGILLETRNGHEKILDFDTVINTISRQPRNELVDDLKNKGCSVYVVGDALSPGNIQSAIASGFLLGKQIT